MLCHGGVQRVGALPGEVEVKRFASEPLRHFQAIAIAESVRRLAQCLTETIASGDSQLRNRIVREVGRADRVPPRLAHGQSQQGLAEALTVEGSPVAFERDLPFEQDQGGVVESRADQEIAHIPQIVRKLHRRGIAHPDPRRHGLVQHLVRGIGLVQPRQDLADRRQ